MSNFLNQYKKFLIARKSEGTAKSYIAELEKFYDYIDKYNVKDIDSMDIESYINHVIIDEGNQPTTSNRKLYTIRSYFNYLLKRKKVTENPAREIESANVEKNKKPVYLKQEGINKFLKAIDNIRDRAIIITFLYTGMRRAELVNLNRKDIDFENKLVSFKRKENKWATIHLHDEVISALRKYLATREDDIEALFISNRNRRVADNTINAIVTKYIKKARIRKNISPHKLRHTFATMVYKHNKDIKTLQNLLGHENISTTQIYTHTDNEQEKQNINALPTF